MAYERFKAIVYPLSRLDGTVTKARLKWMLPLAWMVGLAYLVFETFVVGYNVEYNQCDYINSPYKYVHSKMTFVYAITQYILPSIAMMLFYGRVICALRRRDNALGPQAEAERARRKARKKVMWIVVVVTLVFYVCCGIPYVFYVVFVFYGNSLLNMNLMLDINTVLLTFNSAFNPFVYFFFIQSYRDGFRQVFCTRKRVVASNNEMELSNRPQQS